MNGHGVAQLAADDNTMPQPPRPLEVRKRGVEDTSDGEEDSIKRTKH